jgi:hypothetical protein
MVGGDPFWATPSLARLNDMRCFSEFLLEKPEVQYMR